MPAGISPAPSEPLPAEIVAEIPAEILAEIKARVVVVLVRARNPHNIGAAARAMHDFGFRHLRIVNEYQVPFEGAKSAVDASAVLSSATTYPDLATAVADCTLVIGTSAVSNRGLRHPLLALADAAPVIHSELRGSPGARLAILFGSEKTGLTNDELSFCHLLMTIPMHAHADVRYPSMNLGQAVAVCLYELVRAPAMAPPPDSVTPDGITSANLDRLASMLTDILEISDYTRHHPSHTSPADLRRIVRRMGVDRVSAPIWMGIFRQLLWKLRRTETAPLPESE